MLYSGIDLHKRTIATTRWMPRGRSSAQPICRPSARSSPRTSRSSQPPSGGRRVHRHVVLAPGLARATGIDLRLGHAKYLKAIRLRPSEDRCRRCGDLGAAAPPSTYPGGAHDQRCTPRDSRRVAGAVALGHAHPAGGQGATTSVGDFEIGDGHECNGYAVTTIRRSV